MRENRQFQRVNYLNTGWLHCNESRYNCRLENISKNGALVCLKKTPAEALHPGDSCSLLVYQGEDEPRYREFEARLVRFESDVAALEFTGFEIESHNLLDTLIRNELNFLDGAQKLIEFGRESAAREGIELTMLQFDNGELLPEREMHTLRFSAGQHAVNVHLTREEIEVFNVQSDTEQIRAKIKHAIEQLSA